MQLKVPLWDLEAVLNTIWMFGFVGHVILNLGKVPVDCSIVGVFLQSRRLRRLRRRPFHISAALSSSERHERARICLSAAAAGEFHVKIGVAPA